MDFFSSYLTYGSGEADSSMSAAPPCACTTCLGLGTPLLGFAQQGINSRRQIYKNHSVTILCFHLTIILSTFRTAIYEVVEWTKALSSYEAGSNAPFYSIIQLNFSFSDLKRIFRKI